MTSPVHYEAVFLRDDIWSGVTIRGDWIQVSKTLGCLGGVPATEANTNYKSMPY